MHGSQVQQVMKSREWSSAGDVVERAEDDDQKTDDEHKTDGQRESETDEGGWTTKTDARRRRQADEQ